MSDPDEPHASEHHRTRSMFVVLGVLGLLTVVTPQLTAATTSPPTTPTSTRAVVPARPSPGCAHPRGSQGPGTSDVPVVSRGARRSYVRTIPVGLDAAPAPLIVLLDDGSGDPRTFVGRAHWSDIAQSEHLVLAAPRWTSADDDQLAVDAVIDIGRATCVDLARVYLAGFSTGATLGTRVVCEHPGFVTAFVAVAGLMPPDRCPPDVRVPVLAVQGALDETVSPARVVDAAKAWARQDRCQPEPVSAVVAWTSSSYGFERCEGAVDVQLYMLSDMGHEWPEPVDDAGQARRWADVIDTTTAAMRFLENYSR